MNRSRLALKAAVAAAALAVPIGLAMPASATTSNGCTVEPRTPEFSGHFTSSGIKKVYYKVDVTCAAGVFVTIQEERWEDDPVGGDDFIGSSTLTNDFSAGAGTVTRTIEATLPDTDDFGDMYEEMYQRIKFKVTSGPVTSSYTAWDYSGTRAIHV
jgi:hypothetical protein